MVFVLKIMDVILLHKGQKAKKLKQSGSSWQKTIIYFRKQLSHIYFIVNSRHPLIQIRILYKLVYLQTTLKNGNLNGFKLSESLMHLWPWTSFIPTSSFPGSYVLFCLMLAASSPVVTDIFNLILSMFLLSNFTQFI
jgi:hypothetical protein